MKPAAYFFGLIVISSSMWFSFCKDGNGASLSVVDHPKSYEDIEEADVNEVTDTGNDIEFTNEVFYPTNEWQTVKPGQAVPRGLHVRLNMQTGLKEAKLMEEDEGELKYWNKDGRQGIVNSKSKSFSFDELKQALKKFKVETHTDKNYLEQQERVKKKFRSYDSLKEDLAKMDMGIKSDREIVIELTRVLVEGSLNEEERGNILNDLEYYVHQIDNAVLFCDLGGMVILKDILNTTDTHIKKEAAMVLGSAAQSNGKVQVKAFQNNLVPILLHRLAVDQSDSLRKVYVFALSSLLRNFPFAQLKFLELGGFSVLASIFDTENGKSVILRLKIITLIHDLLVEQDYAVTHNDDSTDLAKQQQYISLPLVETLTALNWCDRVPSLLTSAAHDVNEKTLNTMTVLAKHCHISFTKYKSILTKLEEEYSQLSSDDTSKDPHDDYYSSFIIHINSIRTLMKTHDEL